MSTRTGRNDWTDEELDLILRDYFSMLVKELAGEDYVKASHYKRLLELLPGRTKGSVERKYMNISAVLMTLGFPSINGYKPLSNVQARLIPLAADFVRSHDQLRELAQRFVDAPVAIDTGQVGSLREEEPPKIRYSDVVREARAALPRRAQRIDYLEREARNSSLGRAGEELVLKYEQQRLRSLGLERLASRVDWVSRSRGDGLGYDIHSFEASGVDRLIEVKTTAFAKEAPVYVTRNELMLSRERSEHYHLYRVFDARRSPGLFTLPGRLDASLVLRATQFIGRFR